MSKKPFYITTPIYYPSDNLHIGHSYCTVATDAMARFKRLQGYQVMFLTGTDEHGQKIQQKAEAAGVTPQQYVDKVVAGIQDLWKLMNISNDRFIRTTDDYHVEAVQKIFQTLYDKGQIYKGAYKGKYCTPCESFWTESQLVDGKCPDCGREVHDAEEEAYFFRLSQYADRLLQLYDEHPEFLTPASRVNEMKAFINQGLEDLCVSRTSFSWGIPVPFDPAHVIYVWVDALTNYITALGYGNDRYHDFETFWPADVHFVGKEIVRFHSIIWPAMLMALDLPLPKKVYGHGWLLLSGGKMSKSKGNVVDPVLLCGRYGSDALRYFLLREFPFGSDGTFSNEALITRINADLANDLGNLLSRSVAMVEKYFGGSLPAERTAAPLDDELLALANALRDKYEAHMEAYAFQSALAEVFTLISRANKYIDETAPWALAKNEEDKPRLAAVLYNLLECLRIAGVLLTPFIPQSAHKLLDQINAPAALRTWESAAVFGQLPAENPVHKGEALFPRIDAKKELAELEAAEEAARAAAQAKADAPEEAPAKEAAAKKPEISIDDFDKVQIQVCKVLACEKVKKSKKLLKFQLQCGSETRQIFSGIAGAYDPADLIGKNVVAITNLPPRKMMGDMSYGMILSAEDAEGNLSLLTTLNPDFPHGGEVH